LRLALGRPARHAAPVRRDLRRGLRAPQVREAGRARASRGGRAMSRLRILHVDPERGFSGGETQVLALATHLRDDGHDVLVATPPDGGLARRLDERGIAHHALTCRFGHDPVAGLALRAAIARQRPDVVHHHTARALTLAPYVPRGTVQVVTRRMDYAPKGAAWYVRFLYGRMDAV